MVVWVVVGSSGLGSGRDGRGWWWYGWVVLEGDSGGWQ